MSLGNNYLADLPGKIDSLPARHYLPTIQKLIIKIGGGIMTNEYPTRSRKGASGLFFVGFLILGLSVGFFLDNIVAGFFAGLGVGFIAMAISRAAIGEW
jgi:hypothetical protein